MSIGFINVNEQPSNVKFQQLIGPVPKDRIVIGKRKDNIVIGVGGEALGLNECVIFAVKGKDKTLNGSYYTDDLLLLQKQYDSSSSNIKYKKLYLNPGLQNAMKVNESSKIIASVRSATGAVRSFFGSSNFNKFITSNSSYMFWCINCINIGGSSYFSAIYSDDIAQLKRINKLDTLEGSNVKNITIQNSFVSTNSSETKGREQGGFFINAGYYNINSDGFTTSVIDEPGNYIGVNDKSGGSYKEIKYSSIMTDVGSLSQYDSIYELCSNEGLGANDAIHYQAYKSSGGIGSGGQADINWSDFEIPGIDFDYGRSAMSISNNFISDFSEWKLNFIPAKGVEYNKNKIKKMQLNIKNNGFGGIKNETILEPKIKLNTTEIDLEELCGILDNAIKQSIINASSETDTRKILPIIVKIRNKNTGKFLTTNPLSSYFNFDIDDRKDYEFIYYTYNGNTYDELNSPITFESFIDQISDTLINISNCSIAVQLSLKQERKSINLYSLELFEAYTRGHDFIQENYTTVRPEERDPNNIDDETSRAMSFVDNYFTYKYTGRNIDILMGNKSNATILEMSDTNKIYCGLIHSCDLLQESDVTLGETYGEQQYFIEAIKAPEWDDSDDDSNGDIKKNSGKYIYKDSFKVKDFLDVNNGGFDPTEYSDEDIEVVTSNIDLLQCENYKPLEANYNNNWCDCAARKTKDGKPAVECIYQKLGYCPYRFETEKHPRRIRTLQQSKSNRFNLIQELCKVFEFYPYFYIEHDDNGRILLDENGKMKKHIFFMTEKGNVNQLGFRYEKNLSSISRTLDSSSITTKLYVESVDSQYTDDGLCSIQTATDNIGRTSYILDFSYYAKIGNLDKEQLQRDIYGIDSGDFAFLQRIGEYNKKYDNYSNLIITMTGEKLTELEAQIKVSTEGISTALEERKKIGQTMYQFKTAKIETKSINDTTQKISYTTSDTYKNYILKYREQATILWGLVEQLFFSNNYFSIPIKKQVGDNVVYDFYVQDYTKEPIIENQIEGFSEVFTKYKGKYCKGELFWRLMMEGFEDDEYEPPFNYWNDFKEKIVDTKLYEINGKIGEYKSLYNEVQYWKRERAKILNKINDLSTQFYQKYEPYIKEGTFSDSNYLTDNEYYWAGVQVLDDSCEPQLSYTINVIDISPLPEYSDDYDFDLSDTTFIEDIDFFGINKKTGLPNREKVIVSEIEYDLDIPLNNSIKVQNYSSKFEDLFSSITASVQSLTFNENVYKRASNFTAKQYVTTDSLQSTLDIGDLTLLDTPKENITLDESGTEGNDINNTASQYKITGEGVYFSKDGGETWDYGVGPSGINMDYVKFGSLDASKVQIVDGEYIYFLWDKDGINAYRNPSTSTDGLVDFARFNKYGLSLIENNNVRLRAGYEFKTNNEGSNNTGKYNEELPLTNQNVGFYLYNDSGQPIFKTETRSNYSEDEDSDYTARLSLTGEMFVTNRILDSGVNSGGSTTANTLELKKRYIFLSSNSKIYNYDKYSPILKALITENKNYAFVETELTSNNGKIETLVNLLDNIILEKSEYTDEDGNKYYEYSTQKPYQIYEISYDGTEIATVSISIYTIKSLLIASEKDINDVEITAKNIIDSIKNRNVDSSDSQYFSSYFDNEDVLNFYYDEDFTSGDYVVSEGDNLGKKQELVSIYELNMVDNNATISLTDKNDIALKEIEYKYLDESTGQYMTTSKNLYTLILNGTPSYWEEMDDSNSTTVSISDDGFSTSEVGIFINNKKSLNQENDKTMSSSQKLSANMSDEEKLEKMTTILSGAQRTFMIAAAGEEGTEYKCNNVLSVLKNGVLYIGGQITDYYGKKLDISSLQYMPDEVRINNPNILMTTSGQIWCNWDEFYYAEKTENGSLEYTTFSLKDLMDRIKDWIQQLGASVSGSGSGSSGYGVSGYYIDESDVDKGVIQG